MSRPAILRAFPGPLPSPATPTRIEQWIRGPLFHAAQVVSKGAYTRRPVVRWDLKGQAAGAARFKLNAIRLNRQLLEYPLIEVLDTAAHEMAHLVNRCLNPKSAAHGREWQSIAAALGCSTRRTHGLPLRRHRKATEYLYRTPLGELLWLGTIKHRRVQRGEMRLCIATKETFGAEAFTGESRTLF